MSDLYSTDDGADGSGNPPVSPQTDSTQVPPQGTNDQDPNGNEPITFEQLKAILDERDRKIQSSQDKKLSYVDKRVDKARAEVAQAIQLVKDGGTPMTPELEEQITQKAITKALTQSNPTDPSTPDDLAKQVIVQTTNAEIDQRIKAAGVALTKEDVKHIPTTLSPFAFVNEVQKVIDQKIAQKANVASRLPNLGSGTPALGSEALQKDYNAQVALILQGKHPTVKRGDHLALARLRQSYINKGLENI